MTAIIYESFQKAIEAFYLKVTKDHSLKFTLRNRFKTLNTNVDKEFNYLPELELSPKSFSQNQHKQIETEFNALRKTQPNELQPSNINKSRSVLQKSSKGEPTEKGGKTFNSQWIYESDQSSKILFFAIMLSFVINDNRLSFKYFQDKINDELDEAKDFSDYELSTISRQWQLIGTLLLKNKPMKWKQSLKQSVNKFPLKFIKLACKIMLPINDTTPDLISIDNLNKLAKQMKVTVHFFAISYKQIQNIQSFGKFSQEVCIGRLKHKNSYVVSSQLPEYSPQEKSLREIRTNFASAVSQLLDCYNKNSEEIAIESNSKILKEKELIAKQFLANCLKQ